MHGVGERAVPADQVKHRKPALVAQRRIIDRHGPRSPARMLIDQQLLIDLSNEFAAVNARMKETSSLGPIIIII
jgi:hypothetical protein